MRISRGLAALGVACLLVVTSCSSVPQSPAPSQVPTPLATARGEESVRPAQPTSYVPIASRAKLIGQAVADGRIDQVTGLLYRAKSALGLAGLPAEFASAPVGRDDGVLADITTVMTSLPIADQVRLAPLTLRPTDVRSIFGPNSTAPSACRTWVDSGSLDTRFKVWACADTGSGQAQTDMGNAVGLIKSLWDQMTRVLPAGMGPPVPDEFGSDPSAYGGDPRIDLYLVYLGQGSATAVPAPPYLNPDGSAANNSSGFVLLNRSRLADGSATKRDIIHGLFHVLEWAHNLLALHDNGTDHWFDEASATWAETYFYPQRSDLTHSLFVDDFQTSTDGLESTDVDHEFAAYIWPFFMQQETSAQSVFQAWSDIGPVGAADFPGVTDAISKQLPFAENFRDFALRNLNLEAVLDSAGVTRYSELDARNFPTDSPPTHIQMVTLAPDTPYISGTDIVQPLSAAYWSVTLAPETKLITVSIGDLNAEQNADGDVLLHHATGTWEWRKFHANDLSFCRDDPGQDIDSFYLIVSDHSTLDPLAGSVEATASANCSGPT